MKATISFFLLSAGCAFVAIRDRGWAWLLLWPAVSFLLIALSYLLPTHLGPRLIGKTSTGSIRLWSLIPLLPYFLFAWTVWFLAGVISHGDTYNEIAPGIYVGRRPFARGLPPGLHAVVDMTAEFPVARGVKTGREYFCLPTLDYHSPAEIPLLAFVRQIAALPGPIYIHCAAGKGRSVLLAVCVLIARGVAPSVDAAEAMIRAARPRIHLTSAQRAMAERIVSQLAPPPAARDVA